MSAHNCDGPPRLHLSAWRSLRSGFSARDHMCLQTRKRWSHYLWNWKQEPVTAAERDSFDWAFGGEERREWGVLKKNPPSDGNAQADLLTAAGCRRFSSTHHFGDPSLSRPLGDDARRRLTVSNLLLRLHVYLVMAKESLQFYGCCGIFSIFFLLWELQRCQ